jgi:hypothetical protein
MDFDVSAAVTALAALVVGVAAIGAAKLLPAVAATGWRTLKNAVLG